MLISNQMLDLADAATWDQWTIDQVLINTSTPLTITNSIIFNLQIRSLSRVVITDSVIYGLSIAGHNVQIKDCFGHRWETTGGTGTIIEGCAATDPQVEVVGIETKSFQRISIIDPTIPGAKTLFKISPLYDLKLSAPLDSNGRWPNTYVILTDGLEQWYALYLEPSGWVNTFKDIHLADLTKKAARHLIYEFANLKSSDPPHITVGGMKIRR